MSKLAANFTNILSKPASDFERPKPLPQGTYLMMVKPGYRLDESTKKKTPFVEFLCDVVEATDDVDAGELAEMGGVAGKVTKATFYLTDEAAYRLREFLETLGLDTTKPTDQILDDAAGQQFLGTIVHEPSQDGQSIFAKLGATAPVE